jgi:hypothetical protein
MMAQNAAGQLMVNVFLDRYRWHAPVCLPESSMLCYWTANNMMTVAQTDIKAQDWCASICKLLYQYH